MRRTLWTMKLEDAWTDFQSRVSEWNRPLAGEVVVGTSVASRGELGLTDVDAEEK